MYATRFRHVRSVCACRHVETGSTLYSLPCHRVDVSYIPHFSNHATRVRWQVFGASSCFLYRGVGSSILGAQYVLHSSRVILPDFLFYMGLAMSLTIAPRLLIRERMPAAMQLWWHLDCQDNVSHCIEDRASDVLGLVSSLSSPSLLNRTRNSALGAISLAPRSQISTRRSSIAIVRVLTSQPDPPMPSTSVARQSPYGRIVAPSVLV